MASDNLSLRRWIVTQPLFEWGIGKLRELLIGALSQGPIPRHVAFVMDGNRRYARSHQMETVEGHHLGFEALARILEVCYKCGVKVVTVYAFSIENFNRPKYEVDGLMELARVKLEQIIQHGEILDRYGASVRILGQRNLIRADVLKVVDRAVESTKHNTDTILNICFPYTSREEITQSIRATVDEYSTEPRSQNTTFSESRITEKIASKQKDNKIKDSKKKDKKQKDYSERPSTSRDGDELSDSVSSTATLPTDSPSRSGSSSRLPIFPNAESITAETLDKHMYTAGCPPLDLFIRTSGVERLSDFMLWQCHQDTQIFFVNCLWPEFDLWHFLPVLIEWQWRQKQKGRNDRPSRRVKQQ